MFDPEKHDPVDVEAAMLPERVARLREIVRTAAALHVEATTIIGAEVARLSANPEEETAAAQAITAWLNLQQAAAAQQEWEAEARPAS